MLNSIVALFDILLFLIVVVLLNSFNYKPIGEKLCKPPAAISILSFLFDLTLKQLFTIISLTDSIYYYYWPEIYFTKQNIKCKFTVE